MSDTDPLADLLGLEEPKPRDRRRSTDAAAALEKHISTSAAASGRSFDDVGGLQAMRRPVTINTLATLFRMDVQTITRRLIDCPHVNQGNRKLYEFPEACSYIIKPRMTPEQFVKTLNRADLPPDINLAFWNAQRAKLKFMLEAQEAWETGEVLEVFGEAFMMIKDTLQMVPEDLREAAKLSDEQTKLVEEAIDSLRTRLFERLVEMPKKRQTRSILEQPLFGTSKAIEPDDFEAWEAE